MPNIRIPNASGHIEITKQDATIITLSTADKYVPADIEVAVRPQVGSFNNLPTQNVTYTENTAANTVIPEDGYLYLNKGWFENTKIAIGHLIPEIDGTNSDSDRYDAGVSHILHGYKAWDEDGHLIVGTMAEVNPQFDGGAVTVHPSATMSTQPTATITPDGSFVDLTGTGASNNLYGGYYGVSTSHSGMTSYLTVDGVLETTEGTASVTTTYDRSVVQYNGATTGFVDKTDDTIALEAVSGATGTGTNVTTTIVKTDSFVPHYIPIVSVSATGGDVTQGTGTGTVSGASPALNVTQTGSFVTNASSYGISTTEPVSGTDGTDYLTIDTAASQSQTSQTWGGTATIPWTKTAVTQSGNIAGAIHLDNGSEIRPAAEGYFEADISGSVTATLGNHTPYYIKVVNPQGKGGEVTRTSGDGEVNLVATPTVNQAGTFIDEGDAYGISTTEPADHGTHDGTTHLTLTTGATATAVVADGETVTIDYSRAAILSKGTYQGAVNIAENSQLLDSTTGTLSETLSTGDITQGTPVGTSEYYIKIVTPTLSGGALTADSTQIKMSANEGSFAVTPNVVLKEQSSVGWNTAITNSDYNIVNPDSDALDETNSRWVKIDAGATAAGNVTVSGSITVTRGAVSINTEAGLTNQSLCNTSKMVEDSETYSGTETVSLGNSIVGEGNDLYIREATDLITNTATVTVDPVTVNGTTTAKYYTSGSDTTGTTITLPTTNTSDSYVEFDVTQAVTNQNTPKAYANASATQTKGITKGNTANASEVTVNIVPQYSTTKVRMNVYEGGYAVDGTTIVV